MRYLVAVLLCLLLPSLAFASGPPNSVGVEALDLVNGGQSNAIQGTGCQYGAAVATTHEVQAYRPDSVRWIQEAVSNTWISQHLPGQQRYTEFMNRVAAEVPPTQHVDAIVWIHGENDSLGPSNTYAIQYATRFAALIDAWRLDLGQPDLPIVVAEVGTLSYTQYPWQDVVRAAQHSVCDLHQPCAVVPTLDLAKGTDGVHYTCASFAILGQRLGQALLSVLPTP